MIDDLPGQLADGANVVVSDGLAARQLEAYLALNAGRAQQRAWVSDSIQTVETWISSNWPDQESRQVLSASQSLALWQRVIEKSATSDRLVSVRSVSGWAADAHRTLLHWGLNPAELRAGTDDEDFASFLNWSRDYQEALRKNGWIDAHGIAFESAELTPQTDPNTPLLIWADITEPTPVQKAIYSGIEQAGGPVEKWCPPVVQNQSSKICLLDSSAEIVAAAHWAAKRLDETPEQRIALVVPDLQSRRTEIHNVLQDTLEPSAVLLGNRNPIAFFDSRGISTDHYPPIGAALAALELISPQGNFNTLSRWLRSPFFPDEDADESARALLEKNLREELASQLSFPVAYHRGGLSRRLHRDVPESASRLGRAIQIVNSAPRHFSPTNWTRIWRQVLGTLGWPSGITEPNARILPLWDSAMNEFSTLTAITGKISQATALDQLERILARPQPTGPQPLYGLTLLERPEDVGPGYDAVWLTGFTDAQWPQRAQPNPLLSTRLQLANTMPGSSPVEALQRAQRTTKRLVDRVPEIIFSWPSIVHDYATEPSPLLKETCEVTPLSLVPDIERRTNYAQFRNRSTGRSSLADNCPPHNSKDIPGGAHTLTMQSRAPLRAFLESRLHARPLEATIRGLSPRHRGIVAHRALELFFSRLSSHSELADCNSDSREQLIATSVSQALKEGFGPAAPALRILFDLEQARLTNNLNSVVEVDLKRPQFNVAALEQRLVADLLGYRITCRLDRIDNLNSGGAAVIDYKTGQSATPADWLRERLRDAQIPLYSQFPDLHVEATVVGSLGASGFHYHGVWVTKGDFAGRPTKLPQDRSWAEQVAIWRQQLELLVQEYTAGDTRMLLSDIDDLKGSHAPLTRVYEQLALANGWLCRWEQR
jgi:ATP-dependent helicase/nuclease subunit B